MSLEALKKRLRSFSSVSSLPRPLFRRTPFVFALPVLAALMILAVAFNTSSNAPQGGEIRQQVLKASPTSGIGDVPQNKQQVDEPGAQRDVALMQDGRTGASASGGSAKPGATVENQQATPQTPPKPQQGSAEAPEAGSNKGGAPRGGARAPQSGLVVIDPGHGGPNEVGANRTFPDGYFMKESDLNLKVSLMLASRLKTEGFQVIMTREADAGANTPPKDRTGDGAIGISDDLQARIDIANNAKADLFVSVHFNSAGSQMGGTEVFYCPDRPFADKSRKMAELLQDNLLNAMRSLGYDPANRGVKVDTLSAARTHLYVLGPKTSIIAKPIAMPSVLGEALFISNYREGDLLRDEKTLSTIAEAYTKAVLEYFTWLNG